MFTNPEQNNKSPNMTANQAAFKKQQELVRARLALLSASPSTGSRTRRLFAGKSAPLVISLNNAKALNGGSSLEKANNNNNNNNNNNKLFSSTAGGRGHAASSPRPPDNLFLETAVDSIVKGCMVDPSCLLQASEAATSSSSSAPTSVRGMPQAAVASNSIARITATIVQQKIASREIPQRAWTWTLFFTPACTPLVIAARRKRHAVELTITQARLRSDSIKLPLNAMRMDQERRLLLERDFGKALFATNIFLRQNPTQDIRQRIFARKAAFQDSVDRTVDHLVEWEKQHAAQEAALHQQHEAEQWEARRLSRRTPSRAGSDAPTSPNMSRRSSFTITHEMMASRRQSRRASLVEARTAQESTSTRCTGLIDVRAILNMPYAGPIVTETFKRRHRLPPITTTQSHPRSRQGQPSPSHGRRTKSRDGLGITWGDLNSTSIAALDDEPGVLHLSSTSLPSAGSPTPRRHNVGAEPFSHHRSTSPTLGRSRSAVSTILAPLPREVQLAAKCLTLDDTTTTKTGGGSSVIEQLDRTHSSIHESQAGRHKSLRLWFPKDKKHAIDRTTASSRNRRVASQVLTFYDQHGLIDGRVGEPFAPQPRDGIVYSPERIVEARKAAEDAELKGHHRSRRHRKDDAMDVDFSTSLDATLTNPDEKEVATHKRSHASDKQPKIIAEYSGPAHSEHRSNRDAIPEPTAERLREIVSTVFVRGGDVSTFIRKMEREAKTGLLRADIRRSNKDRLGGGSIARSVL